MIAGTHRSTPAFAAGGVAETFACICCGKECMIRPVLAPRGICPECCSDHEYYYERGDRTHYCEHCGIEPPADWFDVD